MGTREMAEGYSPLSAGGKSGGFHPVLLFFCGLMAMIDGADAQSFSIAAPLIAKALALQSARLGLAFSITALGGAIGYFIGGFLSDRLGAKAVAVTAAIVIGLFQLATSYASDPISLIAIRFVVSLALGAVVPALVTIIAAAAPVTLRHRIQGLFWACFPMGILGGGIINSWILTHNRWQVIFIVGGFAPLIVAFVLGAVTPASPERPISSISDAGDTGAPFADGLWMRGLLTGLIFFFTNGAIAVVMNWTPFLLVRSGFVPATGASAMAWQAAGALISMSLTGFVVERSKIWPVFFSLAIATCAMVLYASFIQSLPFVILSMLLLGGFLALAGTASVFLAGAILPGDRQASGIGLCLAIGRVGQMIFPGLIGLLLQAGKSPGTALLLTAALPACGALSAVILAALPVKNYKAA